MPVQLHAYSQKRILGLSDTGIMVGIRQTIVVTRDVLLQLHQAAVNIIKAGRRTELKYLLPNGIII